MGMHNNQEVTKWDRFRMAIGTFLSLTGLLLLIFVGVFLNFTNLPLMFAGILLVLAGVLIAGSNRLAQLITDMLG